VRPQAEGAPNLPYDSYVGDTTHRFYQMWQQSDCSIRNATEDNPTGCLNDLYPFVVTTYAGPMGTGVAAIRWRSTTCSTGTPRS
jgi:hypothetical protein